MNSINNGQSQFSQVIDDPKNISPRHLVARQYAAAGKPVFPCEVNGKKPLSTTNGFKSATTDISIIDAWWAEDDYNVALCPEDCGWLVVDTDRDKETGAPIGEQTWAAYVKALGGVETYTVETPSGGLHRYYLGSGRSTVKSALGPGIDTRGVGGYVLIPPSVVNGNPYKVIDTTPVAELPAWVSMKLDAFKADVRVSEVEDLDTPVNIDRAKRLLKDIEPYVEGQGSDYDTLKLAYRVRDLGISEDMCVEVMEPWAERSGFDREWVEVKVHNAYEYAQNRGEGAWAVESAQETWGNAPAVLEAIANDNAARPTLSAYPAPKTAADLAAGVFPRADYVWKAFLLRQHVNLLYGNGGAGKTLLSEHVAVAVAAGVPLFGSETKQAPVLLVLAEDDDGETKARLEAICDVLGVNLPDLPIKTWCLPGYDAGLAVIGDDGTWVPGPFMEPLKAQLQMIGPCLLVLDTVSDIAALDETKRLPVNTLCKAVLHGLCREFGATVLVNAHPSKTAMKDGSMYSGSTAWNNAVRSRLTLEQPDPRSGRRVLKVAKANYGQDAEVEFYQTGLTFRTGEQAGRTEAEDRALVLSVTLDLLDRGVAVVRGNGSGQKPKELAAEILANHGVSMTGPEVLAHLNALERVGRLAYARGGNERRGQKAGFQRLQSVASSVASPSQAVS